MTQFKKTAAALALAATAGLAFEGGKSLVDNVRFARAEEHVQSTRQELQNVQDLSTVFRNVGQVVEPSVVQIVVTKTVHNHSAPDEQFLRKFFRDHGMQAPDGSDKNPGGPQQQQQDGGDDSSGSDGDQQEVGTGSGVIMEADADGTVYILTNNHVAGGATEMQVTLADGRVIKGGKTVGADPKVDLAVVKIHADHVIAAKWGDSDQLSRGDWVLAFGSPFGYIGSMTHGIVSALNRQAGILGNDGYENFIQVDAPINPGNSGGPLVNIHGEVVGVNTAIATRSRGFEGIGFAIPSDQARVIYTELKEHGKVTRGWLGVSIPHDVQSDPELAKSFGYQGTAGVIVDAVLDGTPAFGKLQAGDIITAVDGKPVATSRDLRNQVALIQPGTEVRFTVFRDDKETDVTVRMGEQPDNILAMNSHGSGSAPSGGGGHSSMAAASALGLHLTDVNDDLLQKYNLTNVKQGAIITAVDPRSLAAKAELAPGDVITMVGSRSVTDAASADAALARSDVKKGVRLYVVNARGSGFVFVSQDQ
jgi:serine protease Do